MNKFVADANIGLRMLVGSKDINAAQHPDTKLKLLEMVQTTRKLMEEVDAGRVTLVFPDAVVEEMLFTLRVYYKLERAEISAKLLLIIEADNVEVTQLIRDAVRLYGTMNLDIVDIKLSLLSKELGVPILTWDKDFATLNCEHYAPSDIIAKGSDNENDTE